MEQFFARDFAGAPFKLFGTAHLVFIILVNMLIVSQRNKLGETTRRRLRYGIVGVLLVVETSWHVWNAVTGQWTIQTMLPLHLCSLMIWLSIYMLLVKSYPVYEFAYLLGIAGATQALLTPDAGAYGFPHFRFFQAMLSHGALVTAAIYMAVVEGFRPLPRSLVRVFLISNAYMLGVGLVNWLIGSNYLFIARKPETASLLDVLPAWPWYILYIEALGMVMMLLLYAPFAVRDWRTKAAAGLASSEM